MLLIRQGDCVEMVGLLAALLESIGNKTRIVGIAGVPQIPNMITHVYLDVETGKKKNQMPVYMALDPIYGRFPGDKPPSYGIVKFFRV